MIDISYFVSKANDVTLARLCDLVRVTNDAVLYFVGKIKSPALFFYVVNNANRLLVVSKSVRAKLVQDALACVTERRVSEVVTERDCFGKVTVKAERSRKCSRYLRNFERVRVRRVR